MESHAYDPGNLNHNENQFSNISFFAHQCTSSAEFRWLLMFVDISIEIWLGMHAKRNKGYFIDFFSQLFYHTSLRISFTQIARDTSPICFYTTFGCFRFSAIVSMASWQITFWTTCCGPPIQFYFTVDQLKILFYLRNNTNKFYQPIYWL